MPEMIGSPRLLAPTVAPNAAVAMLTVTEVAVPSADATVNVSVYVTPALNSSY